MKKGKMGRGELRGPVVPRLRRALLCLCLCAGTYRTSHRRTGHRQTGEKKRGEGSTGRSFTFLLYSLACLEEREEAPVSP